MSNQARIRPVRKLGQTPRLLTHLVACAESDLTDAADLARDGLVKAEPSTAGKVEIRQYVGVAHVLALFAALDPAGDAFHEVRDAVSRMLSGTVAMPHPGDRVAVVVAAAPAPR